MRDRPSHAGKPKLGMEQREAVTHKYDISADNSKHPSTSRVVFAFGQKKEKKKKTDIQSITCTYSVPSWRRKIAYDSNSIQKLGFSQYA